MKLRCKKEVFSEALDGAKLFEFTKGKIYEFVENGEGVFDTKDDNGMREGFFDTTQIFEEI